MLCANKLGRDEMRVFNELCWGLRILSRLLTVMVELELEKPADTSDATEDSLFFTELL